MTACAGWLALTACFVFGLLAGAGTVWLLLLLPPGGRGADDPELPPPPPPPPWRPAA